MVFCLFYWVLNLLSIYILNIWIFHKHFKCNMSKINLFFTLNLITLSVVLVFHISVNKPPCIQSPRPDSGVISIPLSPLVYFLLLSSMVTSFYWFYLWYFSTHSLLHSPCSCLIWGCFPSDPVVYCWPVICIEITFQHFSAFCKSSKTHQISYHNMPDPTRSNASIPFQYTFSKFPHPLSIVGT